MSIAIYKEVKRSRKAARKAAKRIVRQLDELTVMVAALVDEGNDRVAAKALAADVLKRTQALRDATPKS